MTKTLEEEVTWGMLCEGFQSLDGVPDSFYSAEDPADRQRLWYEIQRKSTKKSFDPLSYKD